MNYELRIKKSRNNGYTIIETMIAVSLFIIIIMAGMGALLNANLLHNKSQNMRSILDGVSFVMEDMSRNLRTGYNYQCFDATQGLSQATLGVPRSCSDPISPGWAIAFEYQNGDPLDYADQWIYYINNGKIFKSVDGATSFVELTPSEIVIDPLSSFVVVGAEPPPDEKQPFVTIKLIGAITYKAGTSSSVVTPFTLQTSVSQRAIDI